MAFAIEPKTDLILQVHYHPPGKPESDLSIIGLTFTSRPRQGLAHNDCQTSYARLAAWRTEARLRGLDHNVRRCRPDRDRAAWALSLQRDARRCAPAGWPEGAPDPHRGDVLIGGITEVNFPQASVRTFLEQERSKIAATQLGCASQPP